MSEVKSAREVSERILDRAIDFDLEVYDIKQIITIINSDRRAIIEKCKESMLSRYDECFANKDLSRELFVSALDSVLSDLEKKE